MECGIESSEAHNCGNLRLRNVRLALGRQPDRQTYIGKASQSARRPGQPLSQLLSHSDGRTVFRTQSAIHLAYSHFAGAIMPMQPSGPSNHPSKLWAQFGSLCRRRRRLGCRSSYSHLTNRNNKNKKTKTATATETFGFGRGHNC